MKVVVILNYKSGEVLIHHYDEDIINSEFEGDIESYLNEKEIYNNKDCYYMCSDVLKIQTVE